jgi:hypothetical protein
MMTRISPLWKRFWYPRDDVLRMRPDGYLPDPEDTTGAHSFQLLLTTEELAAWPCLVLLGEPGMGKSTSLRELFDRESQSAPTACTWENLAKFQTDSFLVQDVFRAARVMAWLAGTGVLCLYLDGLDECRLRIDTVATLLSEELKWLPADRLRLRIACRTTEWPKLLEDSLVDQWGKENVGVFNLAPLRRSDVAAAARERTLDAEVFLRDIEQHDAAPLANRPITLKFLLNVVTTAKLPATRAELYREGSLRLCTEPNPTRHASLLRRSLSPEQRLTAAVRIAGLTVLANKTAITVAADFGDLAGSDLTPSDLLHVGKPLSPSDSVLTREQLREVLDTNLFTTAEGQCRYRFLHQTYAEFLAAEYLTRHGVSLAQLRDLLAHPIDSGGRIIPQLSETAAWVAEMNIEFFEYVLEHDPEVLLRSDVATADRRSKKALVARLLERFDNDDLFDQDGQLSSRYSRLGYPGIVDQLRPYIVDRSKGDLVRRAAIDMAEACFEAVPLMSLLADIALDGNEPMLVREHAACAVRESGDDDARLKLKELAANSRDDDPEDELKGVALGALWPRLIRAEELFSYLTPPKNDHFIGAYEWFLRKKLLGYLPLPDLPVALEWISHQPARRELGIGLRGVIDHIFSKAWESLGVPGVRAALARALASRIRLSDALIDRLDIEDAVVWEMADQSQRRVVAADVLAELPDDDMNLFSLAFDPPRLVRPEDASWVVEQITARQGQSDVSKWLRLARILVERTSLPSSELDVFLSSAQELPALATELAEVTAPIDIHSALAERCRRAYRGYEEMAKRSRRIPAIEPPPQERIKRLLELIDRGDISRWVALNMELTLDVDSTHFGDPLYSDITGTPGWRKGDAATRNRILVAAERYLERYQPSACRTVDEDVLVADDAAGFRALVLLAKERPGAVETLSSSTWKKWAAIALAFPTGSGFESDEQFAQIVNAAYQKAPNDLIDALLRLIDKENRKTSRLFVLRKVNFSWDDRLGAALVQKVKDTSLRATAFGDLLRELLSHSVPETTEYALSLVEQVLPVDESGSSKSREAAVALLEINHELGWPSFWRATRERPSFAKDVLLDFVHRAERSRRQLASRLSEEDVAEFFIWIMREFPLDQDPKYDGDAAYFVSARHDIVELRNQLLGNLEARGTIRSFQAINRIVEEFPQLPWLKWARAEARRRMLEHTWIPPAPFEVLEIVNRPSSRIVESGEQLLEVLEESIDRLNAKLQGTPPAAPDLWNNDRRKKWWPSDERALSDYLKRHLDHDIGHRNVVVNREVQIRRGDGDGRGEIPDLIVDAIVPGRNGSGADAISVVVEVKCEWNKDVKRAMREQLRQRYLNESGYRYGLYVVGWFDSPAWKRDRKRFPQPRGWRTPADTKQFLERDAAELSRDGVFIKAAVVNAALR